MNKVHHDIKHLIQKYCSGNCTPEEAVMLEQWYHSIEWDATRFQNDDQLLQMKELVWSKMVANNFSGMASETQRTGIIWWKYAARQYY